ncbi:hypothetical protein HGRIS_009670 [Hohenbuehelia grisea]|uniref:HSF-type DNA-binding domain-containing protein n=1 Tax=Hohenbuehelia grisea TaxID=104357 RepID=A0ABR3J1V0_9AGAR
MADLYPPQQQHFNQRYQQYPPPPLTHQHSGSSNASSDEHDQPATPPKHHDHSPPQKADTKPQATFLTKLYALLERPENHHMIRWDPQGEHIIVERPEQLALHVLPSIYRQSRFASFSRQLNIYGFMRKVNLRNVDPAIDDPDASTWSHPTLNRHSPPEVVANFKRRVPPRLPKPRKRDTQEPPSIPPPRSAIGIPLTVPSSVLPAHKQAMAVGRARGFSAPGSYSPLNQPGATAWTNAAAYPRSALPPLTVPSDPPHLSHNGMYTQSPHTLHPVTPTDDSPTSAGFAYSGSTRDLMAASHYSYPDHQNWSSFPVNSGGTSSHNSSLSSLLNPSSSGYNARPTPTINTSYSPFASMPMQGEHSASSLSPDSRPTTGYSMSSVSSLPYEDGHLHDYSRPSSSHRAPSPGRPQSSKSSYNSNSLSVRRERRHSQAMSPYPSPYSHTEHQRPSTSPQPADHDGTNGIQRVRSMIQLPSVDQYGFGGAEFAYNAVPGNAPSMDSMDNGNGWVRGPARPSTSTSSISAASHASSSQANTPPVSDSFTGETDINRFSPDFGFVPMNEHLPPVYAKSAVEM